MNFKHAATFVEVARSGSFSVAATRLHTVQSAISRHIHALEEDLGVTLLERSTRRVSLTAAGEVYLAHVQAILAHCEQARHHAQLVANGKQGVLRIGYMSSACAHFLPRLLRRFAEQEPGVEVQIDEMTAAQQLDAFSEGSLDIGFSRPVEAGYEGLIQRRHLLDDPICLVVSDRHPLAGSRAVALAQLAPYPLTLFARAHASGMFDLLISAFHQQGMQPQVQSEPTTMQALLTQVASSQNVALVPGCVRNLQTLGCCFVPLAQPLSVSLEMHWQAEPAATARRWLAWCNSQTDLIQNAGQGA
ncbi:LysR substrate-binding domain-containing protein [Granulosicoccaceae sp. 1_MG-2023]|nr:LysR substrate-binding domain-containing protein [Granulosicoccaceae sp. 1_MG-2023]